MRPQKAVSIINSVMEQWYGDVETKPFIYPDNFLEAIDKWLEKEVVYMKYDDTTYCEYSDFKYIDEYPDYKYPKERLSHNEYTSWRGEMFYISDRWRAFHRVSWLKHGVENNKFI